MNLRNGGAPLRDRSASFAWALTAMAGVTSLAAGCARGADATGFYDKNSVPNLLDEAGSSLTPKCVNLQCSRVSCKGGDHTTISGTVFDPAGQVPIFNAIVYVPNAPISPFSEGVSCDHCGAIASGDPLAASLSDAEGRFLLENVPSGDNIPLVIQIGRWRRQIFIDRVEACVDNSVSTSETHLPRNHREGDIPQYAIVTGAFDPLECLMRKIGIDDEEFTGADGSGRVHLYEGYGGGGLPSSLPSVNLYPILPRYDAVLLACEGDIHAENKPFDAVDSMLEYLNQGGRVYASHFQYYWFAPAPYGAGLPPFPSVARWDTEAAMQQEILASIDTSFPKGLAYYQWLNRAGAIDSHGFLPITQARHDIDHSVSPISQSWVYVDVPSVEMLTFNTPIGARPSAQCGRVAFSDMHVASEDLTGEPFPTGCVSHGLTSQEKALEFMIFDLASCVQEDRSAPAAPLK
jgi:hypothetical protein